MSAVCVELMTSFGETEEAVTLETVLSMLRAVGSNPVTREVRHALEEQHGLHGQCAPTFISHDFIYNINQGQTQEFENRRFQ